MVEARGGLEVREGSVCGAFGSVGADVVEVVVFESLLSVPVSGPSCRVVCERLSTGRRPLASGQEAACVGSGVPCIGFQPISCRARWRPAPPSTEQVCCRFQRSSTLSYKPIVQLGFLSECVEAALIPGSYWMRLSVRPSVAVDSRQRARFRRTQEVGARKTT